MLKHYLQKFSVIFKVNSILAQLFWTYVVLFILFFVGTLAISQYERSISKHTQAIIQYRQQVISYSLKIQYALNQAAYMGQNYLTFKKIYTQKKAEFVWQKRLLAYTDSLINVSIAYNDIELQQKSRRIKRDILDLQTLWENLFILKLAPAQALAVEENDKKLNRMLDLLNRDLTILASIKEEEIKSLTSELEGKIDYLNTLFFWLTMPLLLLGAVSSFWLLRRSIIYTRLVADRIADLNEGQLPAPITQSIEEFKKVDFLTNQLIITLEQLKLLAREIGKGNYDTQIQVFQSKGELGEAIEQMNQNLKQIAVENRRRNWHNEGFAKFAEILRSYTEDSTKFFNSIISNLVQYLEVHQGGIFVLNSENYPEPTMDLKASFAFEKHKYYVKSFAQNEGLIGQAWREKDTIFITDIPEDYKDISSGLGAAKPKSILIVPLIFNDKVEGVIELTSLKLFEPYQIEFVQKLGESIAVAISRVKINAETQKLLIESKMISEQMRIQEEMMKKQLEEALFDKENIIKQSREYAQEIETIEEVFIRLETDIDGYLLKANDLALHLLGYKKEEVLGKHYTILFTPKQLQANHREFWIEVLNGHITKRETERLTHSKHSVWFIEVFYPIYNSHEEVEKVCILALDITALKENELKLRKQVNELVQREAEMQRKIKEVEEKAFNRILSIRSEYQKQIEERDRFIQELKEE
ncbi:MAG: GAF domain-containing protein [Microscillaceae bacterium]|nr:GAF domain-containing protein [Microscillaceae bacterium]MDW8460512.1 GAF domain-containing protein [Cytophagales bacterium]